MSGWDLAWIVRAFHPGAALILLTTEWGADLRSQADGLHRTRVMEKPIHPGELRALVKALQSERTGVPDDGDPQSRAGR
jgi:DNA-binding response OmpR family regulator